MSSGKKSGDQSRCNICSRFLHKWNNHVSCLQCQVRSQGLCDPTTPCNVCSLWDSTTWTLYLTAGKELKARTSRRSLSFGGFPAQPGHSPLTSFTPGRHPAFGQAFPGPWTANQPVPPGWGQVPHAESYKAFLLHQLRQLELPATSEYLSDTALQQGMQDADSLIPPGQRSTGASAASDDGLGDILPLDR